MHLQCIAGTDTRTQPAKSPLHAAGTVTGMNEATDMPLIIMSLIAVTPAKTKQQPYIAEPAG